MLKALNKGKLGDRIDTPWREHFQAPPGVRPGWGALYKPPLTKNAGDLQWRILHGIVAVNSFVLVLNPSVLFVCLGRQFFYCFVYCFRLLPLFGMLKTPTLSFKEQFTEQMFIFGFIHVKKNNKKGCLLNFLFAQAKLAIYFNRKVQLERGQGCDCSLIFKGLVGAYVMLEHRYYVKMEDVGAFQGAWDYEGILFFLKGSEITFANVLV